MTSHDETGNARASREPRVEDFSIVLGRPLYQIYLRPL
jgi:hypothetical protein